MTELMILPSKYKDQTVFVFNNVVFADRVAYFLTDYNQIEELPIDDVVVKADIYDAIDGALPTLAYDEISSLNDTLDDEERANLSDLIFEYMNKVFINEPEVKNKEALASIKHIIKKLKFHNNAWLYSYFFGYDDDMRQVVLDSKNPKSAYSWTTHVKNEQAMKDVIVNSGDIWCIAQYGTSVQNCQDPEVEEIVLSDDTSQDVIDYYLDIKNRLTI